METLYLWCAVIGGTALVGQTVLLVLGGHGHGDGADGHGLDHDDTDVAVKVISVKTLIAFLTFFGLAGLAGAKAGMSSGGALTIGALAGLVALYVVAWLMSLLVRLHASGNVQIENTVGRAATVYLRIPAAKAGPGKVTVEVQGRTIECEAITTGGELPTGAAVRVVAVHGPDLLEVVGQA